MIARYPKTNFTPPPEGFFQGVFCDVVDLGLVQTTFGEKFRLRVAWQLAEIDATTSKRFTCTKTYTNSMHKRASLRGDLETLRGRLSETDAASFDLESLIGENCMLQIVHNVSESGDVYANVRAVVPLPRGTAPIAVTEYVRVKDRPARGVPPTRTPTPAPVRPRPAAPRPAVASRPEPDDAMPSDRPSAPTEWLTDDEIPF